MSHTKDKLSQERRKKVRRLSPLLFSEVYAVLYCGTEEASNLKLRARVC